MTSRRERGAAGVMAVAALLVATCGVASADATLDAIKRKGEIVIGTSGVYPPFEYVEAGRLAGTGRRFAGRHRQLA